MATKKMKFEDIMGRLDEIVDHLEKGDLPLDESLNLFEEGTKLINEGNKLLDTAQQKVYKLKKGEDGKPIELPFEE